MVFSIVSIFQKDSLSVIWFYRAPNSSIDLSTFLYVDNVEFFASRKLRLNQQIEIVKMSLEDVLIFFGLDKSHTLELTSN